MEISKDLPQFKKEKALIIVASKQEGKFYYASEGVIEELASFRFEKPKYSDKEGHFTERGERGVYKQGSVREPKKERIIMELISRLEKNMNKILTKNKIDNIYLSCPDYLKERIKDAFSPSAKKKIKATFLGNYCNLHPFDLLKRMKGKLNKGGYVPVKKSESKIIEKPKKARKIIKGRP